MSGYEIRFGMQVMARANTLEEVAKLRNVSGDLVFHANTDKLVTDPSWLFPWEKEEEDCFAQQQIRKTLGIKQGNVCKLHYAHYGGF